MDHQDLSLSLSLCYIIRLVPTQDIRMATTNLGLTLKVEIWQGRERIALPEIPEKVSLLLIDPE